MSYVQYWAVVGMFGRDGASPLYWNGNAWSSTKRNALILAREVDAERVIQANGLTGTAKPAPVTLDEEDLKP